MNRRSGGRLGVKRISAALGLHPSTVYRYMNGTARAGLAGYVRVADAMLRLAARNDDERRRWMDGPDGLGEMIFGILADMSRPGHA